MLVLGLICTLQFCSAKSKADDEQHTVAWLNYTTDIYWNVVPQDCWGRQGNVWRLKSGSICSSCKMSESPKRLGLLRYISKSSSGFGTKPDSMGSGWCVSIYDSRGWGSLFCSESREKDKRKKLFLLLWPCCLFLVLLSQGKWDRQEMWCATQPKTTDHFCRNSHTSKIWFSVTYYYWNVLW